MSNREENPAFPTFGPRENSGMSLRDYFAAKALSGFCANPAVFAENPRSGWGLVNASVENLTNYCFHIADEMLAERSK